MIWFNKDVSVSQVEETLQHTMASFLGMRVSRIGDDFLEMTLPVNEKTVQPYGYIHGGANCVLIETVGSIASAMVIDSSRFGCVGIEINANHLKSVTKGEVKGVARPLHLGRTTHVWEVKIHDEGGRLTCAGRLTVAVINRENG